MKGKFQQLQTSRDLIFELNLNKHPKDCKNLSLVNAENIKISKTLNALNTIPVETSNNNLNNQLIRLYGDNYKLVGTINIIEELVLFINYNNQLKIHRYELNNEILSDNIVSNEDEEYFVGIIEDFVAEYTFNRNDELIIVYCFSSYDNKYQYPLSVVNLGKWENNILKLDNLNLNFNTFPLCPVLPKYTYVSSAFRNTGYTKKGWYDIYIRYKIDENNYTHWTNPFNPVLIDDNYNFKTIFDYKNNLDSEPIKKTLQLSNEYDFCNYSLNVELADFSYYSENNLYDKIQLAIIVSSKTYTECRITEDINLTDILTIANIDDKDVKYYIYKIDYFNTKEYDINELIKIYNNYYNVKNIINYKNQLWISNYENYNFYKDKSEYTCNIDEYGHLTENNSVDINFEEIIESNYLENDKTFVPYNYYNLYIHKINKYGEISNGIFIGMYSTMEYCYPTNLILKLSDELSKDEYGYFISFSKIANKILFNGYCKIINSNNINFYTEHLNYADKINIGGSKLIYYGYKPSDDSAAFDYLDTPVQINIKDIQYVIAGSVEDNNNSDNTHFKIYVDEDLNITADLVAYIIIDTKENNKSNILIKCKSFTYYNIENNYIHNQFHLLDPYGRVNKNIAITFADKYRINHYNKIVSETDLNELINITSFYGISDEIHNYIQINNSPQNYVTILNEVDYDSPEVELYNSKLFLIQDCVDLFKNNIPKYQDVVLSTFISKEDVSDINIYNKTIRRSNYISDESLQLSWRKFETENYKNIVENKGKIVNLISSGNILLIHTEHSLFQINLDETIIANNRNIQLTAVDAFDVNYKEIFPDKESVGGLANKNNAIYGKFGYIFYSKVDNKIYHYDENKLLVISDDIKNVLESKTLEDINTFSNVLKIGFNNITNEVYFDNFYYNIVYNIDSKKFISINRNLVDNNIVHAENYYKVNEFIETKNNLYIYTNKLISKQNIIQLYNEDIKFKQGKIAIIINENYNKIKVLEYIRYKCYYIDKITANWLEFNYNINKVPKSPNKLRVYNDICNTGQIDLNNNLKDDNSYNDIKKPTYDLGNFNISYLRDKNTNKQIIGNYFIVEFTFDIIDGGYYEFESLDYSISEK